MAEVAAKRREERVKLAATARSNLGVAIFVTGVIAPILAPRAQPIGIAIAFMIGVALHLSAQIVLSLAVANPRLEKADEPG